MINIREVAKMAGVSPSTVSRVINGTAKVSPEKTAKVLQAIPIQIMYPTKLPEACTESPQNSSA